MTIRVLHIIARMNQGGTATYLNNLINGLEKQGIQTLLLFGNTQGFETESVFSAPNTFRVSQLGRKLNLRKDLSSLQSLSEQVKTFQPDIIHSHTFKAGLLSRLLHTDVPLIHTYHGHHLYDPDFEGIKGFILVQIEKFLARRTYRFVGVGESVVNELLAKGIGINSKFESIPPGLNPPHLISKKEAEKRLGIEESKQFTVLWMGRLTGVKNPLVLLDISKALPNVRFIVGGDGELMGELSKSAPKNLHLMGWREPYLLLSASDVVISTSFSEGMSLALIESQLSGKPVIATNVGAVSEIVTDGRTGYLIEPKVSDFIEKIEQLHNNHRTLMSFGHSAQKDASEKFGLNVMVRRHISLYEEILSTIRI